MNRRALLQGAVAAGISCVAGPALAGEIAEAGAKLQGVNLGGWLALAKWITPAVFAGVRAEDEFTLSRDTAVRARAAAQWISYETSHGWFYWTYKTAGGGEWSFRDCVQRGWLPDKYAG